ncbi:hypothetical protein BH20CHL7_BH20CHL7_10110 [soil metagenome]
MTTDAPTPDHGATTDHGPATDHGHGSDALGPIDVRAWGAGGLGVMLGMIVVFCFVLATSPVGG